MASNITADETDRGMDWQEVSYKKKTKGRYGRSDTQRSKRKRRSTGGTSNPSPKSTSTAPSEPQITTETFSHYSTDQKLDCIFSMLQNMTLTSNRVHELETTVREVRSDTAKLKNKVNVLAYKSIDSEARQRRNNLIFYGIQEVVNENCMESLATFLGDKLGLDPDAIFIQRVHRLGRRSKWRGMRGQEAKHRPIIAAFRDFPDVELILANAKKLKGTTYGINRDYPKEIANARRDLYRQLKEIKRADSEVEVSLQYPAKLIVNGKLHTDKFPKWREIMKKSRFESGGHRLEMRSGTAGHLLGSQSSDESELETARETARESSSDRSSSRTEKTASSTKSGTYAGSARYISSASLLVDSPPRGGLAMPSESTSSPKVNVTVVSDSTVTVSDKNINSVNGSV